MSASKHPVALVTGGNRGIGLEVCRQLARLGYAVVLGSRDESKGERAARGIDPGARNVRAYRIDVTDSRSIEQACERVATEFSRCDVLVNNAGILYDTWQRASTVNLDEVRTAFETNTLGAWRMVLAFLPLLRESPHPRVVNVSSEAGSLAAMTGATPAYSLSKAALNALTVLLAADLEHDRILVNAVCPGWVATEMGGEGGRPVLEGAASVVWAVTLPDGGPTGGFFRDGKPLAW